MSAMVQHDAPLEEQDAQVVEGRDQQRTLQMTIARNLVDQATTDASKTVPTMIGRAAEAARAPWTAAAEVFWELVRLRVLDGQGGPGERLRSKQA